MKSTSRSDVLSDFGNRFAALLDEHVREINSDVSARLLFARNSAVRCRKVLQPPLPFWGRLALPQILAGALSRGTIAFAGLLLVVGIPWIHAVTELDATEEWALVDSQILTDDLPVAAYLDSGFAVFLSSAK